MHEPGRFSRRFALLKTPVMLCWCTEKNMHFPISRVTSEGYAAEILALQKLADGNQLGEHFLN